MITVVKIVMDLIIINAHHVQITRHTNASLLFQLVLVIQVIMTIIKIKNVRSVITVVKIAVDLLIINVHNVQPMQFING